MKGKTAAWIVAIAVIAVAAAVIGIVVAEDSKTAEYTVTYDLNYDGAPECTKVTYKSGTNIEFPTDINTTRTDYVFVGWYLDKGCSEIVEFPYKVTGNVTLYAGYISVDATEYFNSLFLESEYGKYLVNSQKETIGSVQKSIDEQYVSAGASHAIYYDEASEKYNVYTEPSDSTTGFDLSTPLFSFDKTDTYGTITSVKTYTQLVCNDEFICIKTTDGHYYVRDILDTSGFIGPSSTEPEIINCSKVVLNNALYCFVDGEMEKEFDVNSTHRPTTGGRTSYPSDVDTIEEIREYDLSNTTYGELITTTDGDTSVTTGYILDCQFNVKYTLKYPSNSHRAVLYYLSGNSYLEQYSCKATSDDYTYSEDGVKYKLTSLTVNGMSGSKSTASLAYPAFTESNMYYERSIVSALYHEGVNATLNIIGLKEIDSDKELVKNSVMLANIGADGSVKKVLSLTSGNKSLSFIHPTATAQRYEVYYVDISGDTPVVHRGIVDSKLNMILADIAPVGCEKYFLKKAESDNGIYDINGNKVGDYTGKTVKGFTNNTLFFIDGSGKLYKFADGNMTECTDYKGELILGESYYGYKTADNEYSYFTEVGTLITTTNSDMVREVTTLNGYHMIEFWNDPEPGSVEGEASFYILITEVV